MIPANHPSALCDTDHVDQRVFLRDVGWDDYEAVLSARGDDGGVRITYFNGELELMTPSVDHESLKKRLARLLETYAEREDGTLRFFVLQDETYLAATRSRSLPELDPALVVRCMGEPTQTRAIRASRTALLGIPAAPDSGR